MKRSVRRTIFFALSAFAMATGCIEVGHTAEVGCLVDRNEPDCPGAQLGDAQNDTAGFDAGFDAGLIEDANADALSVGDADAD